MILELSSNVSANNNGFYCQPLSTPLIGDKTNKDEPDCAPMPRDCLPSSVFPSCRFRLRSHQDLMAETEELLVMHDGKNLDTHSYMLFFSDEKCSDLEGIKGLVSGKSNLTSVDSTITCNKAMTCILAPGGEACRSVAQSAKTIKYINTETTTDGREVLSCLDDGSCEFASSECVKSDILESCYVMWVGPTPLFDQPIALIKGAEVTPNEEGNIAISPASGATIRNSWLAVLSAAFACFM
jgi:hypothetical protein